MSEPKDVQEFTLEKEHELRIECDFDSVTKFQMKSGMGEIFGTELAGGDKVYEIRGENIALFTWHGCNVSVWGGKFHAYVATETPMGIYLNAHGVLQREREEKAEGPRVLIAGPSDSGKSSFAKILTSYAARQGSQCIFVDLDPGQGLPIPGAISAIPIVRPASVTEGYDPITPLSYYFGHLSPSKNTELYLAQITELSQALDKRLETSEEMKRGGVIVNTCGWIDGEGFEILKSIVTTMKIDVVLVMDNDRLFAQMKSEFGSKLQVVKIPKSGGVVAREEKTRSKLRDTKIRHYFYGVQNDLCPQSKSVKFSDVVIYKIGGGPQAPLSALPIGAQSTHNPLRLSPTLPNSTMCHSILAISHAQTPEDVLKSNVAGFIWIRESGVHTQQKKIDLLCPCSDPLPGKCFILGSLKYME